MSTDSWLAGEGPRDKLLRRGAQAVSDAELVAVLLGTGSTGRNAVQLAADLLATFGGVTGLLRAERDAVEAQAGMGAAKFACLRAAAELARRQALETIQLEDALTSPQATEQFLQLHLGGHDREVFSCLFLDSQNRVLSCEDLFMGTLDAAAIYPREVAAQALQRRAAAVILAHNHPSGTVQPSAADKRITERLCAALSLLDIRVLDHMIVGRGSYFSFAQEGLL